jgi:hypothetical protein
MQPFLTEVSVFYVFYMKLSTDIKHATENVCFNLDKCLYILHKAVCMQKKSVF